MRTDERQVTDEELESLVADYQRYKEERKYQARTGNGNDSGNKSADGMPEWWPQERDLGEEDKAFLKALDLPDAAPSSAGPEWRVPDGAPSSLSVATVPASGLTNRNTSPEQNDETEPVLDLENGIYYNTTMAQLASFPLPGEERAEGQAVDQSQVFEDSAKLGEEQCKINRQKIETKCKEIDRVKKKGKALLTAHEHRTSDLQSLKEQISLARGRLQEQLRKLSGYRKACSNHTVESRRLPQWV
jgi:hypothetical protein